MSTRGGWPRRPTGSVRYWGARGRAGDTWGARGLGPHRRGRPGAGTTVEGAGIGAAWAPGAAEAGLLSAFAPRKDPGPEDSFSAWFLCGLPTCTYYQEKK